MGMSKQIGWSPEANLYYKISQQLDRLIGVTSKVVLGPLVPFGFVVGFTFKVDNTSGNAGGTSSGAQYTGSSNFEMYINWGDGSALEYYSINTTHEILHTFTSNSIFDVTVYVNDPTVITSVDSTADKGNFIMLEVDYSRLTTLSFASLSSNKLPSTQVNKLSSELVANGINNGILLINGQTPPAPPTGQGVIDKATLISRGWTVTTD